MEKYREGGERLIFVRRGEKTRRVCAVVLAAVFVALTVFMASLSPDKFFAGLSSQDRVDSIIRTFAIIDGTNCADDKSMPAPRSPLSLTLFGSGHCADISFISRAHAGRAPAHDFALPHAGGTDTVARE
jgi:hypothetical protein